MGIAWWGLHRPVSAASGGVTVRISNDARRCVIFFGVPAADNKIEYGGTGFLVSRMDRDIPFSYLATAGHVARLLNQYEDSGFFIRLNAKDGTSVPLPVEKIQWRFHPDPSVDLAVAFFGLNTALYDHVYFLFSHENWVTSLHSHQVASGDVVSVTGLFRLHHGKGRNVPIVHTGHVALLPDPGERVPVRDRVTGNIIEAECYLVEAQTLDGLSGSPVFIHEIVEFADFPKSCGSGPKTFRALKLLGVYTGAWDGEPGTILAADRNLRGGVRVPVGMGTVVPVSALVQLIDEDAEMKKARQTRINQQLWESAATTGAANADAAFPPPPSTDANPKHREDFNSLVNAAARKREQED